MAAEDDDEIEGRIAVMAGRGSPWPMGKTCGGAACIGSDAGGVLPGAGVGAELFFNVEAQARCIGSGSRFIDEPINAIGAAGGEAGGRVERAHRIGTDIDAPDAA